MSEVLLYKFRDNYIFLKLNDKTEVALPIEEAIKLGYIRLLEPYMIDAFDEPPPEARIISDNIRVYLGIIYYRKNGKWYVLDVVKSLDELSPQS